MSSRARPCVWISRTNSVVEADSGAPVPTDSLKYGQRLMALAWPCNPLWRTPGGIELVGPRYFKYDRDYVPFEQV